ncbi:MAG: hypothetical protein EKK37_16560 [Sphingobacteriales bacterium]|nr:MAG: hypothetical protein EKK37_16560 [Sphingobacteriales bacterium]
MSKLKVERLGGIGGFGGNMSHLRSVGEVDLAKISDEDKKIIEALFELHKNSGESLNRDNFRYRITRKTAAGTESIEAEEDKVPTVIKQCVKDEIV